MSSPALPLLALLALLAACASGARGYRVLVAFPHPGRSRGLLGHSVVDVLLDAGHEVTYVTAHPVAARAGLRHVDVSSLAAGDGDSGKEDDRLNVPQLGAGLAARALRHRAVRALLADRARSFDVVVADWFHSGLLAPLAAVYECPLVWYSAGDVSWLSLRLVHEAGIGSAAPPAEPHALALADRARHLWMQLYWTGWMYYIMHYVEEPAYKEVYGPALSARGRAAPAYEALVLNASLLLVNSHPPLGQRVPLPQSVQYVGGHHLRPPTPPLPTDLQKILDNAVNGAIFFSLGSNLKSADFPERMKRELVEVLGQLEQTVLWALEGPPAPLHLPSNLHVLGWAPQTSILNHSNTILLISHGGPLSVMEATQFGVPVVGVPLLGDQFVTVDLTVARGCGIRVDFAPDLPVRIKEAVNEILGNFSYRGNSAAAAVQFAARAAPARLALARWVRAAVVTRGAPHLRSPALLVPAFQLDLLLVLALALALALGLLYKVLKAIRAHWTAQTEDSDKKYK